MPGVAIGRRFRGALLRLVLNRFLSAFLGAALMAPAAWMFVADLPWESGFSDGVALLAFATGCALVWTAAVGRQPDWIDPDR